MAVILDITISLDGFVTAGPGEGLGALHEWAIGDGRTPEDVQQLAALTDATGAVVMGRHTFDVVDGPDGWNDDIHYGADQGDVPPPCFVVTIVIRSVSRTWSGAWWVTTKHGGGTSPWSAP